MGPATDGMLATHLALVLHLVAYKVRSILGWGKVILPEKGDIGLWARALVLGVVNEVHFGEVARHIVCGLINDR